MTPGGIDDPGYACPQRADTEDAHRQAPGRMEGPALAARWRGESLAGKTLLVHAGPRCAEALRLFRQTQPRRWDDVMLRVSNELRRRASS